MEIDSTRLDVMVRLDDGVEGRVELTGMVDVATRSVTAAVLQPSAKSADASVLLARTVTQSRCGLAGPGGPVHGGIGAAAPAAERYRRPDGGSRGQAGHHPRHDRDHGNVFMSRNFRASCAYLGISLQPARKATGSDKPRAAYCTSSRRFA